MRTLILACVVATLVPLASAEELTEPTRASFHEPLQVLAGGEPIAVQAPGFACPAFEDVDGDGLADLVVGQFSQGKMHFFKNIGSAKAPKFAKGDWIRTGDEPALVPDVW